MITALVTSQVTSLVQNSSILVTRAIMAAILGVLLSGCIPYPILKSSQAAPDVVPGLPEDLLSSNGEVLVLVQSERSKEHSASKDFERRSTSSGPISNIVNAPAFMRGKELISLSQRLSSESVRGFGIFWFYYVFATVDSTTKETLQRLCVVAKDGRSFTFLPAEKERFATYRGTLTAIRRDAIVSALREDTNTPFGLVDGPCGIYGEVNWPKETRSRTIDYLTGIPGNQTAEANKPLAQILRRAKTAADAAGPGAGSGMLLVSTSRYGQTVVEAPMFFSAADFSTFKEAVVASDATQIIPLLLTYASGMHALEGTSLSLLCAVGSDGRVVWWSNEANAWQGLNKNLPSVEWWNKCLADFNELQQGDRLQADAFLDRLPVEVR